MTCAYAKYEEVPSAPPKAMVKSFGKVASYVAFARLISAQTANSLDRDILYLITRYTYVLGAEGTNEESPFGRVTVVAVGRCRRINCFSREKFNDTVSETCMAICFDLDPPANTRPWTHL